ncbi:YihY/virulence factor BrkB family protein [Oceanobacillus piezotolerans]|uniref:YihY/virulence factor BrkB family protein n=1 Tax=Oceanobacillus piezotolerans TaxID=2448030 RepID=A0A498D185_9BACI|nr:YihY/virulence factor BrkB family protein [Oceanobacillus piezotolerans]RLL40364.1 YihY/virulence factor BrkB family protein [Oceanobacillus piezotolerans]
MSNVINIGKRLYQRIDEVDVFGWAAQLAYFFLLSLFPFLLFLFNLIGYIPIDSQMILDFIGQYAPSEITTLIETNVNQILNQQNGGLLSIGIIGTLWAASNAVNAIMKAFNKAYGIEEDRSFIAMRLLAVVLTVAMVMVIIISLLLPIFGRIIGEFIFSFFGLSDDFLQVWGTLRWVISTVIFFIVLLALYKLAPNKIIYFRDAVWGAILGTILWQIVSFGFSFYVNEIANYSANYGSLGTIIILMLWFYLFGIIILLGGVVNATIEQYRKKR